MTLFMGLVGRCVSFSFFAGHTAAAVAAVAGITQDAKQQVGNERERSSQFQDRWHIYAVFEFIAGLLVSAKTIARVLHVCMVHSRDMCVGNESHMQRKVECPRQVRDRLPVRARVFTLIATMPE